MSVTGHYKVIETLSKKIAPKRRSLNEQGTKDCYDRCARENVLLLAVGYATICRETSLDDPGMSQVRAALERILRQHVPRSPFAFARYRNLVMPNDCYVRFLTVFSVWSLRACHRSRRPPCRAVESALLSIRSEGRQQNERKLGSDRQIARSAPRSSGVMRVEDSIFSSASAICDASTETRCRRILQV
jgi:hypothetical protein